MADYFTRLAWRALGQLLLVQPRVLSQYAEGAEEQFELPPERDFEPLADERIPILEALAEGGGAHDPAGLGAGAPGRTGSAGPGRSGPSGARPAPAEGAEPDLASLAEEVAPPGLDEPLAQPDSAGPEGVLRLGEPRAQAERGPGERAPSLAPPTPPAAQLQRRAEQPAGPAASLPLPPAGAGGWTPDSARPLEGEDARA